MYYRCREFIRRTGEAIQLFRSFLDFRLIGETLIELTGKNRSAQSDFFSFYQINELRKEAIHILCQNLTQLKKKKKSTVSKESNVNYIVLESIFHVQHLLCCVLFMPPALFPMSNSGS